MKKISILLVFTFITLGVFANDNKFSFTTAIHLAPLKKIDITITAGGYTFHIVGNANYSMFSGQLTMSGTITITGNGVNINVPFNYSGPMNQHRGVPNNDLVYNDSHITNEDKPVVDILVKSLIIKSPIDISLDFMNN